MGLRDSSGDYGRSSNRESSSKLPSLAQVTKQATTSLSNSMVVATPRSIMLNNNSSTDLMAVNHEDSIVNLSVNLDKNQSTPSYAAPTENHRKPTKEINRIKISRALETMRKA